MKVTINFPVCIVYIMRMNEVMTNFLLLPSTEIFSLFNFKDNLIFLAASFPSLQTYPVWKIFHALSFYDI